MSLVNLVPEDYVARQAQKRANLLCSLLFGVVVAGVLAAAIVSERGYRRTREVDRRVSESYAEAGKLIQQLQALEATRQRLMDKGELTAGLLEPVPRSYLLAVVTRALPEGASLIHYKLESKRQVTVSGPAARTRYEAAAASRKKPIQMASRMDVEISVTGLAATDVETARFIAAMARCPLMETVDLVYSQEKKIADAVVRQFQVTLKLKPDADVRRAKAASEASLTRAEDRAATQAGGVAQ